jgi:transposase
VQVSRFLKRWGFTWQKPARKAIEQDSAKAQKWLESDYPGIKRLAGREKADIFWGDEMGARSDASPGKCHSVKGDTPRVKITGKHFSCNMVSAISNRGQLFFSVFTGKSDFSVFESFLSRLIKQSGKKIFMIIDGHPAHRSRRIKAFAEENKKSMRIFFLPSFSPELNPDERLNQDVKTNAARRKRADNQAQMKKNLRCHLHRWQKQPELVKRYFHDEPVKNAM